MVMQWSSSSRSCCRSLLDVLADSSAGAQTTGIREVSASDRSLIPLQTRLRYTTMIVLPEDEEILDVICGDRDFWVISATQNIAHVKPAKAGAETNLNLVTASGTIYSFLLTEKSEPAPDLKVYVNGDAGSTHAGSRSTTAPRRSRRSSRSSPKRARRCARAEREARRGHRRVSTAVSRRGFSSLRHAQVREAVPRALDLARRPVHLHQVGRHELPALYEVKDGKPALVNFQVQHGTYVVPKVLDGLPRARQRSASRSRSRGGSHGRPEPEAPAPRPSPIVGRCRAACCRAACRPGSWRPSRSGSC